MTESNNAAAVNRQTTMAKSGWIFVLAGAASLSLCAVIDARAWEMPGTAIFLAGFISLFGDAQGAILPARLAQAVLLVCQAGMVAVIAQWLFKRRSAAIAAYIMVAFY